MKTILPILLMVLLVSCANPPPPGYMPVEKAAAEEKRPTTPEPETATAPVVAPETSTNNLVSTLSSIVGATNQTSAVGGTNTLAPGAVMTQRGPVLPDTNNPPGVVATPSRPAQPAAAQPPEEVTAAGVIKFRGAPLEQVLQIYAEYVNRTLLYPATLNLQQQITLVNQTPLSRTEVIQALDAVLALNGISLVKIGDKFVKVVPQAQAVQEGGPTDSRKPDEMPPLGQFITQIIQLKYVKPSEIVQALQPFAKLNSILPVDSSQIIVIRDYTENVKRMLEMIQRVDIAVPAEFVSEVIPIKYAKASEIADALNSLSGGGGGGASVGRSSTPTQRQGGVGGVGGMNRTGMPGYQQGGVNSPFGAQGGVGGVGGVGGAGGAGGGSSFTDRLQNIIRRASTSGDLEILGKTKMIADERSNSLLIFATRQDLEMIKNVISKLDVVLSQVLIETVILDVQLDNAWNFSVSAGQPPKNAGDVSLGGVNNNPANSAGNTPLNTLAQFFGGVKGSNSTIFPTSSGLAYFGRWNGNMDVAVAAAASDSRINVIQKPRILTSHATPGQIFVGQTVPYITSTYYGGGFNGGPSSQYQQLSVGIGLQVTPYINPDGLVVMQIDETIDELAGSTDIAGVGAVPNTTHRTLSAEVACRDGDTIILGGFIRNSSNKTSSGVPLLKDIPLLGYLFSSRSDSKERSELLVLMRPTVLKTPEIAALTTTQEKNRMPGVSHAEKENTELEKKLLERERTHQSKYENAPLKDIDKEDKP